jgi:hypothetical protein
MSAVAAAPYEDARSSYLCYFSLVPRMRVPSFSRSPARLTLDAAHVHVFDRLQQSLPLPAPTPSTA